jgi:signal transduction histidine kinase
VPGEADAWIRHCASVLLTGEPKQVEQRLEAPGRNLSLTLHRLGPAGARRMAVLFHERSKAWDNQADLLLLNQQLGLQVDRAQAERQLFAQLVDSSLANVMVVDLHMRLLAINRTARQTFAAIGLPVPAFGSDFRDYPPVFPQAKAQLLRLWERALAGEVFVENVALEVPPAQRHFEMRFNLLRDHQGVMLGAYLFAYDITQRVVEQTRLRDTEQALHNAQKMEAVGQLTGGIAHDFNNLLGGISGALELASQRLDQGRSGDARNLLDIAQQNAERAAQLVQRLLAFARHQSLQPRAVDLHVLLRGMHPLIVTSLGDHITLVDLSLAGQWQTCVDPSQLENALLNLCINARDAMPGGGTLTLACANLSLSQSQGQALHLPPGDYLQLKVLDNGVGMSEAVSARAADPFFTTKPLGQGTGLGLSMVYGFVRQSGGQLHIYSSPGQGTRVHLYLPRHVAGSDALEVPPVPAAVLEPQANSRVMLVEDDPILRVVIAEVLLEQGYQLSAFDTGIAALEALHAGAAPALLITDIGLPAGLDGRKLALEALALQPQLRILFITGYDQAQALAEFPLTEAMASIGKPFKLDSVLALARRLLDH